MIPTSQESQTAIQTATGSSFWVVVLAVWLVMFTIAGSLALALAIWKIIEAF